MELSDALMITVLGLGVVFSGLLLTALLISSFSIIPRLFSGKARPNSDDEETTSRSPGPPISPEILSVITTVLEIERRLYHADPGGRLTIIRRKGASQS